MDSKQTTLVVIILILLGGVAWWFYQYVGVPSTETPTATSTTETTAATQDPVAKEAAGLSATLSIVADKEVYTKGDTVTLTVYLDTPVAIDGTDVTFTFPGDQLELTKGLALGNFSKEVSQLATAGEAQQDVHPLIQYASSTKVGTTIRYTFSALALPGQGLSGKIELGKILLRAKKEGTAPITIFFEKRGVSTDSNVVYKTHDILNTVQGTTVRVQNAQ